MSSGAEPAPAWSRPAPSRLAVLDPGGVWSRWEALGTAGLQERRDLRLAIHSRGPLPDCETLLVLVPAKGLDRREYDWVKEALPAAAACLFVAPLTDADLVLTGRNDPGHVDLAREIAREFGSQLLPVPLASEPLFVDRILRLAVERALWEGGAAFTRRLRLEIVRITEEEGLADDLPTLEGAVNFDALARGMTCGRQAECVVGILDLLDRRTKAEDGCSRDLSFQWDGLAQDLRDECARQARHAQFHGGLAEELVAGMTEVIQKVARELEAWSDVPFPKLEDWRRNALVDLLRPELCLPVAGVFSSGKTTLFNYLLGKTPKGLPLLRTSATHNTALLCHFHHRREGRNRVDLVYRQNLQFTVLSPSYPVEQLAVCTSARGTVQAIRQRSDGGHLILLLTAEGRREWIFLDKRQPLLPEIRRGAVLSNGDPLTPGIRRQEWEQIYLEDRGGLALDLHARMAHAVTGFLSEGKLRDARWELRTRSASRLSRRFQIDSSIVSQRQDPDLFERWRQWLQGAVKGALGPAGLPERKKLYIPEGGREYPIEMRVIARVVPTGELRTHELETDEDWDWFQGAVTPGDTLQTRTIGFSESATAAYLVERADLYLNAPLFQLVSLVDTPGLNSITDLHERITEEFIHQGHAFLLLGRLERGAYEEATGRAIASMIASLDEQRIDPDERADRIFLVLNWFRDSYLGTTEKEARNLVEEFQDLASRMIGSAKVRVYLVDLSPTTFHHQWPDTLLGYPSLQRLLDDLRSFLLRNGLSPRLQGLGASLRRVWSEKLADLEALERNLVAPADSMLRTIRDAMAALTIHGAIRKDLHQRIDHSLNRVLRPIHELRQGLSSLSDRGDFERMQTIGSALMTEYNVARQILINDLVTELNDLLRTRLRGSSLNQIPSISRTPREASELPTMAPDKFFKHVGRIASDWPSGWKRFWSAVFNFEFHSTAKRNELINEFTPASRISEIEKKVEVCREKLKKRANDACDEGLAGLADRLKDTTTSEEKRKSKVQEIDVERQVLAGFQKRYLSLLKLLEG